MLYKIKGGYCGAIWEEPHKTVKSTKYSKGAAALCNMILKNEKY